MQWESLLGHATQRQWFQNAIEQHRLATSFLLIGPEGIGKRTFARLLAKSLLCRKTAADQLAACGQCEDCLQVDASTHPDLIEIAKPEEKSVIPLDLLIGKEENRMREGLCHDICLRPFGGRRKVAIIDDADYFNDEGANALLKTLEEPPTDSVLLLIGTSLQRQLPTIRSRCQCVLFQPLKPSQLSELILRQQLVDDPAQADELASISGGNLSTARQLNDPDLRDFRKLLLSGLTAPRIGLSELTKSCSAMTEAVGKEARLKRERLKLIIGFAVQLYRDLAILFSNSGDTTPRLSHDDVMAQAISKAANHWRVSKFAAVECWKTCLTTIEYVDRNVNQASVIEWWIAKLAEQSGR